MRRKDREVIQQEELEKIINGCQVCRLGLWDGREPYIVPMNFGYERREMGWAFYFHSAAVGRKLDVIAANPTVALEMDGGYALKEADTACGYGYRYQSAMGVGQARLVTDPEEKKRGLRLMMERQTGLRFDFTDDMAAMTTVICVTAESLTGKRCD